MVELSETTLTPTPKTILTQARVSKVRGGALLAHLRSIGASGETEAAVVRASRGNYRRVRASVERRRAAQGAADCRALAATPGSNRHKVRGAQLQGANIYGAEKAGGAAFCGATFKRTTRPASHERAINARARRRERHRLRHLQASLFLRRRSVKCLSSDIVQVGSLCRGHANGGAPRVSAMNHAAVMQFLRSSAKAQH